MKEVIRDSLKGGLVLALIGIVAGVGAPLLLTSILGAEAAGALGVVTGAGMLHTVLLFGAFGFLEPIVKSVFNFVFGSRKTGAPEPAVTVTKEPTTSVNISIAPSQSQEQAMVDTKHAQNITAERITVDASEKAIAIS